MNGLIYLNLSPNSIEGEVPQDIGELNAIVGLDLSGNHFSGILLSKLGDLQNLKSHDLSNNLLSGPIPLSFANLIILEILDLSINTLSGTIPRSLEILLYLKAINVLFNNLEGEIPNGSVFANFTQQSFLGNRGLCGVHLLEVPSSTNPEQQSKSKGIVVKIVTLLITKKQNKGKSKDVEKVPETRTHQLVFYHEIQRETNYFDETNLIGVGSFGSVYKGILSGGSVVAIKVLDLKSEEVYKRFPLKPSSRAIVMLDAAMGIEYLDHGHITPIVHCDLKEANILLDKDMVDHVGDFGISKILALSKSMAYTKIFGTLGYIAPDE
ncbi:hypothetical protein BC332_13028 [Capsicum chinense]|nr:hypothetical protein BC332_13028 [Capsicum chinense]